MAVYVCRRCAYEAPELWESTCPGCGGFYRARKLGGEKTAKRTTAADAAEVVIKRKPTGLAAFDHVLSGGIVKDFVALFGGPKGSGKTTLMMQVLDAYASRHGAPVLFASCEEQTKYLLANFNRVGALNPKIEVMGADEVDDVRGVIARCKESGIKLAVLDSLQVLGYDDMPPSAQRDIAVAAEVNKYCKAHGMAAFLMNHMNKSLEMVGSTRVGHDVDVEIEIHHFNEKDDGRATKNFTDEDLDRITLKDVRTLLSGKIRGGESGRKAFFLTGATGLVPLATRPVPKAAELMKKTKLKLVTDEDASSDNPTETT